jgi:hypothetical protein
MTSSSLVREVTKIMSPTQMMLRIPKDNPETRLIGRPKTIVRIKGAKARNNRRLKQHQPLRQHPRDRRPSLILIPRILRSRGARANPNQVRCPTGMWNDC